MHGTSSVWEHPLGESQVASAWIAGDSYSFIISREWASSYDLEEQLCFNVQRCCPKVCSGIILP